MICGTGNTRWTIWKKMVVKAVGESGGYGMLIGPQSTAQQREEFRARIQADPRNYIAQPTLSLSCAPCLIDGKWNRGTSICGPIFDGRKSHAGAGV